MDRFFHWRIKVTSLWKKDNQKLSLGQCSTAQHHYFKGQNFSLKSLSKNTIFIKKMLVTDVVTGKNIEEAKSPKPQCA